MSHHEPLSLSDRSLQARRAAFILHSRIDSTEHTAQAREAFLRRFLDQVDPDRVLPEQERRRRADLALKAHMTGLALRSARARRKGAGR